MDEIQLFRELAATIREQTAELRIETTRLRERNSKLREQNELIRAALGHGQSLSGAVDVRR